MKNFLNKYGLPILLVAAVFVALPAPMTHAASGGVISSLFGFDTIGSFIEIFLAYIMNMLISVMSLMVAIAGMLLNFSMNLTLSIKSFVDSTPAIFTTWRTIRDISGLFMIFFLLYAAFQLITGIERPNFNSLIKNIVMAGILINFSFFAAGLGIDASNIISVQLYNAIAPKNNLSTLDTNATIAGGTFLSKMDGGLADIFMNRLQVQSLYNNKIANPVQNTQSAAGAAAAGLGVAAQTLISGPVKIILMGSVAIIIEFAAAMSFGAAAIAFIFRFVVLILLLAFSPIMALGFLPEVGAYSKKWMTHYMNMLIFMPVYLLLMYVALSVLTTSPIFSNAGGAAMTAGVGNNTWYSGFIALGVNAVIVIVLLNMPLAAAASIAGGTIGFLKKAADKVGYDKWFGMASGYVGAHTIGGKYGAAGLDKAIGKTKLGNSLLARDIRGATTGALAKSKFGGERSNEDYKKEAKATRIKYEEIDRKNAFTGTLANVNGLGTSATPDDHKEVKATLGKLSDKERLALGEKTLKDPNVIRHLKKKDFEAIEKSDDLTQDEKDAIADAREATFIDAIDNDNDDIVSGMLKTYSGTDLLKFKKDKLGSATVVPHLTQSQLKDIMENSDDKDLRDEIYKTMDDLTTHKIARVPTEGWLKDQRTKGFW